MTHTKISNYLLLVLIVSFPGFSSAAERVTWEVPDSTFIENECRLLDELSHRYSPAYVEPARAACQSVLQGKISPDQWLKMIDPIAREIDFVIPCPYCSRSLLSKRQPIPDSFESYSVFLVPGELFEKATEAGTIMALREAFTGFGDAIGDKRLAIWFSRGRHAQISERGYGKSNSGLVRFHDLDALRSKAYCDRFGLNYSDGPYVVTTQRRPDLVTTADEKVVIKLAGIPPEGIVKLLNILEQDLRMGREISKRALLYEEVKQRILTAAKMHSDIFQKVVTTVISGGK